MTVRKRNVQKTPVTGTKVNRGVVKKIKTVRVGNFTVEYVEVGGMPCIQVRNVDATWLVRVSSDGETYGVLDGLLTLYEEKGDDDGVSNALHTLFFTWQLVTGISNGYFHSAIQMLGEAYVDTSLLKGGVFNKKKRDFRRRADKLRKMFLDWSSERDKITRRQENEFDITDAVMFDDAVRVIGGDSELLDELSSSDDEDVSEE